MQINLLSVKPFEKKSFASLIVIFMIFVSLMTMLPFSNANVRAWSTSEIAAPTLTTTPTIDGNWTGTEWCDAPQYNVTGSGGTGHVRAKYNSTHLFIVIDSVWDTTLAPHFGSYEGTYVAFDSAHNAGGAPQTDDYLFFCAYSTWMSAWQGNGAGWAVLYGTGFNGEQALGTSPNSGTPHRIDEMAIPLAYVGSANSTVGFYVMVRDDGSWNGSTYTSWVEWPPAAGGNSTGWPMPPSYVDPCPAPEAWGNLKLAQRPVAAFTFSPPNPSVGDVVTFNASGSYDPDGEIANYTWNWGDSSSNVTTNAVITHAFSAAGSHDVNLTATDSDGLKTWVVQMITIGVKAAFTFSPPNPNPGEVVVFNGTASYSHGGTIANYTWNWGDSSSNVTTNPIITHTFSAGGSYNVSLTVIEENGLNSSVTHMVLVGAPKADFTFWPSAPNLGDVVTFNASGSYDPDGEIANYTWNWGDSSSNVTTNAVITHAFSTTGNYNVTLTAKDYLGLEGSFAHSVSVYAPRQARFSFSPSTPNVGDTVTFNASLSKDPNGTIANYTWNFDDGNVTTVSTAIITHTFSVNGSYNVNLTITDNDDLKSWYNNTIYVGIAPVEATAPFSPTIPTIDGARSSGEWDDADQYTINGTGGESSMLIKWGPGNVTGEFLYILVDSPWDITPPENAFSENTWTAFDTDHDKSTVGPQIDDYLFNSAYTSWHGISYQGNGTVWKGGYGRATDFFAVQSNASGHRIDEIRIPLAYVGTVGQTSGFHVIVSDDSTDPDGWGLNLPPTAWVEWPAGAGGDPRGWPVAPEYIDPCPTLDKWGYLLLEPPVKPSSNVTLALDASSITLGESVAATVSVSNSTGAKAWVDVTIQYRLSETTEWTNMTTVTTSSTGSYVYDWTPTEAGTYEIRASWTGDAYNYGAESEIKTLKVTSGAIPILLIVAALAIVIVVAAATVYFLKVRKPKP